MNKMLERALAEVARLPDEQQESIAANILDDIHADKGWEERFAKSQSLLAELSKRAGEHVKSGTTSPFDPSDRPKQ